MAIEDDHGLHGLDHQNSEFMSPQINDEDPLKQVNHEDDPLSSLRPKSSSDSDEDGRSKRARSSPESNSEERELLGLTLNKTPSFVNLIETQLSEGKSSSSSSSPCPPRKVGRPPTRKNANKSKTDDFAISSEKLKASNFPARKLQVGDWERISKHEGDLIAKCYYAKRKLVWEILDGPLKNKIEIQWSDIIAIRAITPKGDHPGVLEIELNEPPILYRETNPQPRKHTLWQQSADFTGGQVGIHRRHCVTFPPGILDKHYEKLLGFDSRLNELSKKPYPSILCPYFPSYNPHEVSDFPFDSVYGSPLFPKKLNNPFYFSPALLPNRRLPNKSAMAAIPLRQFSSSFPISGERRSNFANINQRRALWGGQGSNNSLMNVAMGNQTNGMLLDQGSSNSLMTVALGNQTSGMLLDQGSNNSLMNVAMGNQTSGMLLDQGSNNSLMNVAMGNQTSGMLLDQGSNNSLMNVAMGNQTSGMLLDQGSNNSLMNVAMGNQTSGMLLDQGSNNSLMNVAMGNQTSGMLLDQGSNNSLMNVAMGNQTSGMLLDQGSNNSLMTVALGNQTSGMLGGQGSDNSLMNVALANQTSGMLLDQGSDNSLMTVVMECRQTLEMLRNQGSSNNLMNVALGNQTSGMLGDQGSNNNLMNAAMENQTIGMLSDQGSNNSLMNFAMGNQTSGMLHSSSTTPQADWVVPTQDDHQQNNSLPNNEFISVLDFMTNHLLNENNQVASSSNENLDSMYPLLEHQGNESLVAASDMHDLYSGYQTVSNYAENVVPDYGMTYAEPLTWMYPEETSEILGLGQTMESLLADPYYQTLDANQGIRKSGNVISKRTELSFYINNIVSNDHKQVWRSKATRMSMHLKPSSMFSLTVNQHASYGKLLDILWVSNTKANHYMREAFEKANNPVPLAVSNATPNTSNSWVAKVRPISVQICCIHRRLPTNFDADIMAENNKNIEAEIMVSRSIVGSASDGLQEVIDCKGIVVGDSSVSPKINLIPFMDNPPSSFRTDIHALDNVFPGPRNTLQTVGISSAPKKVPLNFVDVLIDPGRNCNVLHSMVGDAIEGGDARHDELKEEKKELEENQGFPNERPFDSIKGFFKVSDVDLSNHLTRRENFIVERDKVRASSIPELLEEKRVDTIGTRSFSSLKVEDCFPYFNERRDVVQHSVRSVWNITHRGRIGWGSTGRAGVIRGVQRTIEKEDGVLNIPLSVQPVALIVFERKDFVFSPPIEVRGWGNRGKSTPEVDHGRAMVRVGSRKVRDSRVGEKMDPLNVCKASINSFQDEVFCISISLVSPAYPEFFLFSKSLRVDIWPVVPPLEKEKWPGETWGTIQ
ncbi:hypothetical protein BC332_32352 [Capsicum chinense]|nr:hypothetical protein BC332_32352 [Capsicum chinense]